MEETSRTKTKARRSAPTRTREARESQLVNMAMDFAESKMRDGTATSQIVTHYLKLGTLREQLELEKLRSDLNVAQAKIKRMESQEDIKELYANALAAMRSYSGLEDEDDFYDEEEYENY